MRSSLIPPASLPLLALTSVAACGDEDPELRALLSGDPRPFHRLLRPLFHLAHPTR